MKHVPPPDFPTHTPALLRLFTQMVDDRVLLERDKLAAQKNWVPNQVFATAKKSQRDYWAAVEADQVARTVKVLNPA